MQRFEEGGKKPLDLFKIRMKDDFGTEEWDLKLCEDSVLQEINDGTHSKFFPLDEDMKTFVKYERDEGWE